MAVSGYVKTFANAIVRQDQERVISVLLDGESMPSVNITSSGEKKSRSLPCSCCNHC